MTRSRFIIARRQSGMTCHSCILRRGHIPFKLSLPSVSVSINPASKERRGHLGPGVVSVEAEETETESESFFFFDFLL